MAQEPHSAEDLLPLLESSDLQHLDEIRVLINEHLSAEQGSALLNTLVEYYLETGSAQAVHILTSVKEPHDKHLLEKLTECVSQPVSRHPALTLLGHVVQKQPPWIHKVAHSPLLQVLLRCLKADTDVAVLVTGVLVLVTLLPMIPEPGKQQLYDLFDIFGRLAAWNLKSPGHVTDVHLHATVYCLFHRLYGMYPCNFISYLRSHYSRKENLDTFEAMVKPMLEQVRMHPELVTGSKDHELDPSRWKRFEVQDIVIECAKVSLDPREASYEEGYVSMPEQCSAPRQLRPLDSTASPFAKPASSHGSFSSTPFSPLCQPLAPPTVSGPPQPSQQGLMWSPSFLCGVATPPPSRGISPTNEQSQNASHSPGQVQGTAAEGSGGSRSAMTLTELSAFLKEQEVQQEVQHREREQEEEELLRIPEDLHTVPPLRGFDSPFSRIPEMRRATSTPGLEPHSTMATPRPGGGVTGLELSFQPVLSPPAGYEALFDLALPRAAALFGSDAHSSLLNRLPLSRSADWTHFGKEASGRGRGSAPVDELQTLRSQLLLLHSQLQYERHKRKQQAVRNRRLLHRIHSASALQEPNSAMREQLKLQDAEIQVLQASLQAEQQRIRQLREDREATVTRLRSQNRQLQQGCNEYYTSTQELQIRLQECQKRTGELEAELQKANSKVCDTGQQLRQLSARLSSSEGVQQQMVSLNKQLLLLGEVNRLCVEELQHRSPDSSQELWMLQDSAVNDVEKLQQGMQQQGQQLEVVQQRLAELETQLARKEHLIMEQKRFLEDVKSQARCHLQASESRYQVQRQVTQVLQTEVLQLYSRLEMEVPACSNSPAGGAAEAISPALCRPEQGSPGPAEQVADGEGVAESAEGSSSTLSPGELQAAPMANGGQEPLTPPLLVSAPLPHPGDAPLSVGSYPSAKSFLGMRARELFRNKSESQCESSQAPPIQHSTEPIGSTGASSAPTRAPHATPTRDEHPDAQQRAFSREGGGAGAGHARHSQLSIMDYNETHHEHS
ncbi:hypothetical protein MATL_G00055990 [Megalops atlanticus]|uniref:Hamartin n=1 Tax=Megalops atlanticus TaxID=7932 RepID=A0A9D3Q8M5_MEGAT|nr:hypothetical protein MATL_G00055990 [Megalops atlanticus]